MISKKVNNKGTRKKYNEHLKSNKKSLKRKFKHFHTKTVTTFYTTIALNLLDIPKFCAIIGVTDRTLPQIKQNVKNITESKIKTLLKYLRKTCLSFPIKLKFPLLLLMEITQRILG